MAKERDVIGWITVKGNHIPIYEGESSGDAIKRKFGTNDRKKIPFKGATNASRELRKQELDKKYGKGTSIGGDKKLNYEIWEHEGKIVNGVMQGSHYSVTDLGGSNVLYHNKSQDNVTSWISRNIRKGKKKK